MMGRVTLLRSVLSSIPVYLLSNTLVPVSVLRKLERLFRTFIWGHRGDRGGIHLLAWEVICQPTSRGGLGIHSLLERREILATRLAVRFLLESGSIWASLLRAKYGDPITSATFRAGRGASFIWREICARAPGVLPMIRWEIGDGRTIRILEDRWLSEGRLQDWPTLMDHGWLEGRTLSALFVQGEQRWDVDLVRRTFDEQLAERVLALPIPMGMQWIGGYGACPGGRQ